MKAEWRSVWRGSGGLCVTVGGTKERHVWCAGRLDMEKEVRTLILEDNCDDPGARIFFFELQEPHL